MDEEVKITRNFRTALITEDTIKTLSKIPINKDFSPKINFPYLWGPNKQNKYEVRSAQLEGTTTICVCANVLEAANLVMLLRQDYLWLVKQIKKNRKKMKT